MRTIVSSSRGFTLVEIIVSIVAFGILMTLITGVFAPQLIRGTDPLFSMRAAELGQSYLEEILGKRFDENSPFGNSQRCGEGAIVCAGIGIDGGETAGTENTFDDVDDYSTLTPALNAQPLDQSGGNVRNGYADFHVHVAVVDASADFTLGINSVKRIDVTIVDPLNAQYLFTAFKANF